MQVLILRVRNCTFVGDQSNLTLRCSPSIRQKIADMIDSPTLIVSLLATSLPQQATYFMQISFVSLVISGGMEILRVVPIGMAVVRSFVGPKLTEKEQRTTFLGLRPLYDPLEFQHADFTSNAVSLIPVDCQGLSVSLLTLSSCCSFPDAGVLLHGVVRILGDLSSDEFYPGFCISCSWYHPSPPVHFCVPYGAGQWREDMGELHKNPRHLHANCGSYKYVDCIRAERCDSTPYLHSIVIFD